MKTKKVMMLAFILVLLVSTVYASSSKERIRISKVRFDDPVRVDDLMTSYISISNTGKVDIKDAKITLVIPELGLRKRVGPFRINDGKSTTKILLMEIPDYVEPGMYYVRITASSDDSKRVLHRYIEII